MPRKRSKKTMSDEQQQQPEVTTPAADAAPDAPAVDSPAPETAPDPELPEDTEEITIEAPADATTNDASTEPEKSAEERLDDIEAEVEALRAKLHEHGIR
jgi:hypothetical protein